MVVAFDPDKMANPNKKNARRTRRSVTGMPVENNNNSYEMGGYNDMVTQQDSNFAGSTYGGPGGGFNDNVNDSQFGGGFDQRPGNARGRR